MAHFPPSVPLFHVFRLLGYHQSPPTHPPTPPLRCRTTVPRLPLLAGNSGVGVVFSHDSRCNASWLLPGRSWGIGILLVFREELHVPQFTVFDDKIGQATRSASHTQRVWGDFSPDFEGCWLTNSSSFRPPAICGICVVYSGRMWIMYCLALVPSSIPTS